MIKNVIFDFGGVLVDWNPRYFYGPYFKDDQKMEWFLSHVCTSEWNAKQDGGRTFAEAVAELKSRWSEYSTEIELFDLAWPVMLKGSIQESVDFLKELKSKRYGLYGLTNWSAEKFPYAFEHFDFFSLFDGIVVSGEVKLLKPDPAIFHLLLERYHLDPSQCVFIDDTPANCEISRSIGLNTIHFENTDQMRTCFEQICAEKGN